MVKDPERGALKAFNFDQLLDKIPELQLLDCVVETTSFNKPLDSSNMNVSHWVAIAEVVAKHYDAVDGFVILHGSDTMSYSAAALSFMFQNLAKPIVFTGSQLPIGDLRTDAKENLITAIQVAALRENSRPVIREVCLYFEYKLYRGNRTTKINADHFNAFASPNYPALAESGVHLKVSKEYLFAHAAPLKMWFTLDSHVMILKLFPGLNELVLDAILKIKGLKGLVLETYGAGNAPSADWFVGALSDAIEGGLHIVNVTQCSGGSVSMGQYETSTRLQEIGVISGRDITTEAAVAKMMYLLGVGLSGPSFKVHFEASLCGEMS